MSARRPAVWAADLALLAITLIWGVTFPVVKGALADASPLSFTAVRLSLGAALLWFALGRRRLPAAVWGPGMVLGLCLGSGYALQTTGLAYISPSVSAFITSLSVVLVPVLLALCWRRPQHAAVWWGAAVAVAGLYLLIAAPASPAAAAAPALAREHWGELLTALCALAFAFQIVLLGRWAPRYGFRDLAILQVLFGAIFCWVALPTVERPHWHFTPRLWIALALTAVLATALAFAVQSWAQQFTPAVHAAVIFSLEPVFAALASAVGWHELLRPVQIAGAALIIGAVFLIELWRPPAAVAL